MVTVVELKAEAKRRGLKGYSKMKKAELIQLLGGGLSGDDPMGRIVEALKIIKKSPNLASIEKYNVRELIKKCSSVAPHFTFVNFRKGARFFKIAPADGTATKQMWLFPTQLPSLRVMNSYAKGSRSVVVEYKLKRSLKLLDMSDSNNLIKFLCQNEHHLSPTELANLIFAFGFTEIDRWSIFDADRVVQLAICRIKEFCDGFIYTEHDGGRKKQHAHHDEVLLCDATTRTLEKIDITPYFYYNNPLIDEIGVERTVQLLKKYKPKSTFDPKFLKAYDEAGIAYDK